MKLHAKLILGFGSLWIVLLASTVLVLLDLRSQSASLEDAFHSNFDSVDFCTQMNGALDDLNQQSLLAVWSRGGPDQAAVADARQRFKIGAQGQSRNITLEGEQSLTDTAFAAAKVYDDAFSRFVAMPDGSRMGFYQSTLLPEYLAARNAMRAVNDLNFRHLRTVNGSLQHNLASARTTQIFFAVIGAGFAFASIIVLTRTILGPLHALTESVRQVEAGNLDFTVPVRAMDELGNLAVAFNAMAARLRVYRQLDHARLSRTQQTTQLAIDSLPDAVAVLNPHGEVEISNFQARTHFGMTPGNGAPSAFPEWLRELISGPLATGRPVEPQGYHSAVQLFDKGIERFFLPRAVPMFGENGAVIGVVVTLVDVTHLRRADEVKSCLVSTVSHELKTPLAAARFSAHLLAQESIAPLDDRQRRLVKAACEGTDRLHRIIEDLLQFQRFEEGRQVVRQGAVAPQDIFSRAAKELQEEFNRRDIELVIEASPAVPPVLADADLVNHVLTNLLSNALKFVPKGGRVVLGARAKQGKAEFAVSDNGPGIPAEHVPKLFSRFYRAAAPPETSGAGLGLSIARQLIEAQGGRIFYQPADGGGASFVFELATVAAAPAAVPAA